MMEDEAGRNRERMVEDQIRKRGVRDEKVLAAMRRVPRHLFVPDAMGSHAYDDEPLPIGDGQTISQPYIVAYMTEALGLKGEEKILEIGTGSGYQTAVLAEIVSEIYTVEIVEALSLRARNTLTSLGYDGIHFRIGDGTAGWEENAPYDAVLVTAAPAEVPRRLQEQLRDSGRMIIPVGTEFQELILVERKGNDFEGKTLLPVRFVPLVTSR